MAEQSSFNQAESSVHGGARKGAGRKRYDYDARHFAARGIDPLMAYEILARVADERRVWKRLLTSADDRVVLQAMMYLMSMRDGKAAQSINVTSTNVNISARDIESARAIVREIRGDMDAGAIVPEEHKQALLTADAPTEIVERSESERGLMLSGGEGGKKGGVGE